jgi:hypothetical protein
LVRPELPITKVALPEPVTLAVFVPLQVPEPSVTE